MRAPLLDNSKLWIALLAAAGLGLLLLAGLQYRWTGDLARADRARLEGAIRDSAKAFARDFDEQFHRPVQGLLLVPPDPERGAGASLANRFAVLQDSGVSTRAIQGLYVLLPDHGPAHPPRAFRLNVEQRRLVPVPWTNQMERIVANVEAQVDQVGPRQAFVVEYGEHLAIVQPELPGAEPEWEDPAEAGAGIHLLELDRRYVVGTLLPELARRHFAGLAQAVAVRVVRHHPVEQVEFASGTELAERFLRPDASAALFTLSGRGPRESGWVVEAVYSGNSLDQIVTAARWRNLALSLGILCVLAASLVVLLLYTRRAQKLANLQMEFVAGVSHELRTPLSVLSSAGDNLAEGIVASEQQTRRYGALIRTEARRLTHMVEQILRFAGLENGRISVMLEPVDTGAVLVEALRACDAEVRAAGCEVETSIPEGLPPALADGRSLLYACRNLIHNAAVHAGAGRWIGVRVSHREATGRIEIRVADRGPGIARSEQRRIFEPFFRGRRAVEDQVHGFGLGLALVKRILQAQHGTISVESEPGCGAAFLILLPVAPEEEAPHDTE